MYAITVSGTLALQNGVIIHDRNTLLAAQRHDPLIKTSHRGKEGTISAIDGWYQRKYRSDTVGACVIHHAA